MPITYRFSGAGGREAVIEYPAAAAARGDIQQARQHGRIVEVAAPPTVPGAVSDPTPPPDAPKK